MVWQVLVLLARKARHLGASGGMLPQKIWDFRLSEMVSDAHFATKAPVNCNAMMTGADAMLRAFRGERTWSTAL